MHVSERPEYGTCTQPWLLQHSIEAQTWLLLAGPQSPARVLDSSVKTLKMEMRIIDTIFCENC